ncbi:flagella synthesis protein FlgN [Marinagarivorans cellulosilyticus]|uniref:Flagella synthesis protein FlgN n=1 Tax=Marinagarivorans cellulosilyticus TaxID=2721545 RepID=A0AAN2BLM7_9GAMM|nr:flagellar protein FlgN [Marinagarivorans cellulosilyticus]BCD99259.1 flagella synthesis protein FlgN [Marinagarivorans cellulosilyticus]
MSFAHPLNNDRLAKSISNDINACQNLLALLEQEREHLKKREIDSLDALIEAKSKLLNQLHQSALTRTQWTSQYQSEAQQSTASSAEQVFSQYAIENGLAEQWQKLQQLFKACQDANEVNGKVMMRSQSTHERLLNILRGQGNNSPLYNGKGAKHNQNSRGTLGEA